MGWSVTAAPSGFVLHTADFVYGGDAVARGTLDSATATEGQRVAPGQTLKFDIRYGGVSQAPVIGSYAPRRCGPGELGVRAHGQAAQRRVTGASRREDS